MPKGFGQRFYQQWVETDDLVSFRVTVQETDLLVLAFSDLSEIATDAVIRCRHILEAYTAQCPEFRTSLVPLDIPVEASPIIRTMGDSAKAAGVGPFAAIAGAIAEFVGKELLPHSAEILIENGGDIFAASARSRLFGIYTGDSPFSGKIALKINASQMPCGVCTSSGRVGHSLSFGNTDAVIVVSKSTPLADAWATAFGNSISNPDDFPPALRLAEQNPQIDGLVLILGDEIGAWGNVEFVRL